ncbi:MAG TPA: DNA adenine methylase [Clostridium sp.]|nr:modification methylase [Clostridium sp. Bc-iso-3]HHV29573.1 DNA adenine methylase [Clostridium sp.]
MRKSDLISPIVKWVGGKRQILDEITKYVPQNITTYYEPFVGGGAVFFELQPSKAVINDINSELMNLYQIIKSNVEDLIEDLKKHKNEPEYFYQIRELDRDKAKYSLLSPVERASRVIYLNKTCFNGLFRVNRAGQFNTPFGNYKNPNIVNEETLRAVSEYFNKANISFYNKDYAEVLKAARKGAFVYLDPPYDPVSDTSSFTGYDKSGFNKEEQFRLKHTCDTLNKKGISFLLSNSATDFIFELYKDYKIEVIKAKRVINSRPDKRGEIDEVLVRNFE